MDFQTLGMAGIEQEALAQGHSHGRDCLRHSLQLWIDSIRWPSRVADPGGGAPYALNQWSHIQVQTVMGPFELRVPYYWKSGVPSLRPVQAALGLRGSLSPGVERHCGLVGSELPFATCEKELQLLTRLNISRETIRQVCLELGEKAEEAQHEVELPKDFGTVEKITTFIDGGRINTDEGWKEPRLARIEIANASGRKVTFTLTGIICAALFWSRLDALLRRLGGDSVGRMAFLADGADWILYEAMRRFPKALCVLDFYHLAEHIHDAAKQIFGEGTREAKTWAKKYRKLFKRGSVDRAMVLLRRASSPLGRKTWAAHKAMKSLLGYLKPRVEFLRYATARRRGFPIGSGKIEALVKQAVNLRMKRNGAWWKKRNAERVLALRCAKLFDQLDPVWKRSVTARTERVPPTFRDLFAASALPVLITDPVELSKPWAA